MSQGEPGTGTQLAIFASPPDVDDGKPCTYRINGRTWKVGKEYIDTEIGDVCVLTEVFGKSLWCDTRSPEDTPGHLQFEYERYSGYGGSTLSVDPHARDFDNERFIERYTADPPLGAPEPPW